MGSNSFNRLCGSHFTLYIRSTLNFCMNWGSSLFVLFFAGTILVGGCSSSVSISGETQPWLEKDPKYLVDDLRCQKVNNAIYYCGTGQAASYDVAKREAEIELVSNIQIHILSSASINVADSIGGYKNVFRRHVKSFSSMYLNGVEYIKHQKKSIWGKGHAKWTVLAYIHHDSVASSYDLRKTKIRSLIKTGQAAAKKGRIGETLRNFYWGQLLARSIADTLSLGTGLSTTPTVAIQSLLNNTLEDLQIYAGKTYQDFEDLMVPMTFTYHNLPVTQLSFSYYDGVGRNYALAQNGRADIPLYSEQRNLSVSIEYVYYNEMEDDPEIRALQDLFSNPAIKTKFVPLFDTVAVQSWPPAPIPAWATEALWFLNDQRVDIMKFLDYLEQYRKLGKLRYGRKTDFIGENCFVAVADDRKVGGILYFDGTNYFDINSGQMFSDIDSFYKGIAHIWFKEIL